MTVTWLIAQTGSKLVPAYDIIAAAALSILVVGSTLGAVRHRPTPDSTHEHRSVQAGYLLASQTFGACNATCAARMPTSSAVIELTG